MKEYNLTKENLERNEKKVIELENENERLLNTNRQIIYNFFYLII